MTPETNTGLATSISTIALAGIGTTSLIEWLPKSAILALCMLALAVAGYFVKRDYQRLGDYMAGTNARLGSIEATQRACVTTDDHRETNAGVHRKIDQLFERIEAKLDSTRTRLTIVETKVGVHDDREPGSDPVDGAA